MVAQLPPRMPRQLDAAPAAQAQPTGDLGRASNRAGSRDQPSAAPARKLLPASLEQEAQEKARPVAGSASDALLATRDAVRTQSVERVSVVDGADRMVYSETRDRKGWRQPLAAQEALGDASRTGAEDGDRRWRGRAHRANVRRRARATGGDPAGGRTCFAYALRTRKSKRPGATTPAERLNRKAPQDSSNLSTVRETPTTRARAR